MAMFALSKPPSHRGVPGGCGAPRACNRGAAGALTGTHGTEKHAMLQWALGFLVLALVAGVLGFGGIAAAAADIGRILFFVFLVLFLVGLIAHMVRRRP